MFIREYKLKSQHIRVSKTGKEHQYHRTNTMVVLRCDNCDTEFERARGSMDPKRLSNNYYHRSYIRESSYCLDALDPYYL